MKNLIVFFLLLTSATTSCAQTHFFMLNGQRTAIDVASTINTYYEEASSKGIWSCIPTVLEYAAKELHLSKAEYLYGISYIRGIDRNKNIDKGIIWLKKSADKGLKDALGELGAYYLELGNYSDAERYLLKASTVGANWAYYNLGKLYMELNKAELAEKYYKLAINYGPKGQLEALQNLYRLLARQVRIIDILPLLRMGAESYNDPYSQGRLGEILYTYGANCDKVPSNKDKEEGKMWLKKSADRGDARAKQFLSKIK